VHVAVLGWIGLAVLSTLTTLWPIVLATRITAGTERLTRASLWPLVAGLVVLTAGLLTGWTVLAVVGLPGYAVGVDILLIPFLRTLRPRTPAAWMLAAGTRWLLVALAAGSVDQPTDHRDLLVPVGCWPVCSPRRSSPLH
jgi:nitrite reductase (NO-forming)